MNGKIAIVVLILILGAAFIFYRPAKSPKNVEMKQPATSGNVDDVTNSMLNASASEQAVLSEEATAEQSLYNSESAEIGDFGQSYNPNEF